MESKEQMQRAKELMDIGNRIEDKIKEVQELEKEIEKLQIYRNERGEQLLIGLIDQKEKKKE
jgi:hypothetical protein